MGRTCARIDARRQLVAQLLESVGHLSGSTPAGLDVQQDVDIIRGPNDRQAGGEAVQLDH